jgi:hypothetical protein
MIKLIAEPAKKLRFCGCANFVAHAVGYCLRFLFLKTEKIKI